MVIEQSKITPLQQQQITGINKKMDLYERSLRKKIRTKERELKKLSLENQLTAEEKAAYRKELEEQIRELKRILAKYLDQLRREELEKKIEEREKLEKEQQQKRMDKHSSVDLQL